MTEEAEKPKKNMKTRLKQIWTGKEVRFDFRAFFPWMLSALNFAIKHCYRKMIAVNVNLASQNIRI